MATSTSNPNRNSAYRSPAPQSNAPQGTFLPGTKVQVGSHRVIIEKYLSEGGFAHVYVVRVPRDNHNHELAVLKRVAVPDKEHLANMRTEVETMKKLTGHKHVVTYMDSHASPLKGGGGYEVFLLMEYCNGGGLIDFMNTRLQHRLTEPEILKIFGDVAEGVACMHYLKPPLLHRDLKVENVLISQPSNGGSPIYKVCDFGSAAHPRPAAKTTEEGRLIEEDVQQHTTMQYRSPEMIDVWRKQPIDEKADIWALGVFLYKLCYYTTPFEDVGQMAILNASFKYPSHPSFSDKIKKLIGWMLKEDPKQRPNIYQTITEICRLRGKEVPIKDIYANRTHSEARNNEYLPPSKPAVGLQKDSPQVQAQKLPEITPMRRGRPTAPAQQATAAAKPGSSSVKGDPFAALDSRNYDVRAGAVDELSKRFPSLDDFTITQDKGEKFRFGEQTQQGRSEPVNKGLQEQVTNSLADEAFGQSKPKSEISKSQSATQLQSAKAASQVASSQPPNVRSRVKEMSEQKEVQRDAIPRQGGVKYTDSAVGTSPPSSRGSTKFPEISKRPIWRVPDTARSSSQPRASDAAQQAAASLQPSLPPSQRSALLNIHRSKSQTAQNVAQPSASSRTSLEGGRPSYLDVEDSAPIRTKSAQAQQRPSSAYVDSNLDFLRDQETSRKRSSFEGRRISRQPSYNSEVAGEEAPIDSDMDYLRSNEHNELPPRRSTSNKSSHRTSHSLVNAGHMIAGRFGDAFKRFERTDGDHAQSEIAVVTTRTGDYDDDDEPVLLSPIQGSEATPTKRSEAESSLDEVEDLPPDVRRELERMKLAEEERRVTEAAAEYKSRAGTQATGGVAAPTRASTIQKRVQSLLDEGRQSPVPFKRTAEGYGRFTDSTGPESRSSEDTMPQSAKAAPPIIAKKPQVVSPDMSGTQWPKVRSQHTEPVPSAVAPQISTGPNPQPPRVASRPSVPPKSQALRTGGSGRPNWPPTAADQTRAAAPATEKPLPPKPSSGLAALLAKDLEGVPDYPPRGSSMTEAVSNDTRSAARVGNGGSAGASDMQAYENIGDDDDDMEADFSKRYPTLAGIEMVETEIGGHRQPLRMREV